MTLVAFKFRDYIEFIIFLVLVIVFYFARLVLHLDSLEIVIFGILVGLFLAIRASERAVEGVDSAAKMVGITTYVAGVLSSLASNAPELVIGFFSVLTGNAEFAVGMIVIATGFNILLLGVLIVIVTYKKEGGKMQVPAELLQVEVPVMRGAIIMLGGLFIVGIATIAISGEITSDGDVPHLPSYAALLMVLTYLAYLYFIIRYKGKSKETGKKIAETEAKESQDKSSHHFTKRQTIILLIMGFTGIVFAGEMISQSVEVLGHQYHIDTFLLAFFVGACAALPEHAIALVAATREGGAELGLGNTIAGAMQNLLLMIGSVGLFYTVIVNPIGIPLVHLTLSETGEVIQIIPFILIQLGFGALLVFLIKSSVTDDKQLSLYEGIVITIAQLFVFIIFLSGMHWI